MISEERVEKAVIFIRDAADQLGGMYGHAKGLEHQRKIVRARQFMATKTGTVQERLSAAESSEEYLAIVEELENAWADWKTLETKIEAAKLTIEVWRSQNATKNKGHF